jgi:hypothetical protein
MKLHLPASYEDLTLGHLMVLETTEDPVKRVQAVTGLSFAELRRMPQALIMEANAHLDTLQKQEVAKHLTTFELNGTTYGFIPDWENFSAGEWIDMETYTADFWKTAHKAMSILYRPLDRKWKDTYTIEEYTAKEDAEAFKDMPAPLVAGALLFFWTTERALLSNLQSSLLKATKEAMSSLSSGDGIQYSTHWLVRMSSRWTQLRSSLWGTLSRIWPTSKTSTTSVSNR